MKKTTPPNLLKLRKEAEELLEKDELRRNSNLPEWDMMKLKHELQVQQIELELQNEELIRTKNQSISISEKFVDIYNFIPSGIITLSYEGIILNLNYLASKLLGIERRLLINTLFIHYIHPKSISYYKQLINAIDSNSIKSADIFLISKTEIPICVHIDAIAYESHKQFSFTLFDITNNKRQEEKTSNKLKDLIEINNHFHFRELKLMDIKDEVNHLLISIGCEEQYLI